MEFEISKSPWKLFTRTFSGSGQVLPMWWHFSCRKTKIRGKKACENEFVLIPGGKYFSFFSAKKKKSFVGIFFSLPYGQDFLRDYGIAFEPCQADLNQRQNKVASCKWNRAADLRRGKPINQDASWTEAIIGLALDPREGNSSEGADLWPPVM